MARLQIQRLNVHLEPVLANAVEDHCKQTGATRAEVVRRALRRYLTPKPKRERARRGAD